MEHKLLFNTVQLSTDRAKAHLGERLNAILADIILHTDLPAIHLKYL